MIPSNQATYSISPIQPSSYWNNLSKKAWKKTVKQFQTTSSLLLTHLLSNPSSTLGFSQAAHASDGVVRPHALGLEPDGVDPERTSLGRFGRLGKLIFFLKQILVWDGLVS